MSSPLIQDSIYSDIDGLQRRIDLLEKRNANVSGGSSGGGSLTPGSIMDVHVNSAAGIQLSKLATDPRARATHTGTQLAATISDLTATITGFRIDQFVAPTATWSNNNQKISNVANPTLAQDVATKAYIDTLMATTAPGGVGAPVGAIHMWAASAVPAGYLLCNGATVPRLTYPDLFAVIGTTYNTGGEAGTDFRLPNFVGRFPMGVGNNGTLGSVAHVLAEKGGAERVALSVGEMPSHDHGALTGYSNPAHMHPLTGSPPSFNTRYGVGNDGAAAAAYVGTGFIVQTDYADINHAHTITAQGGGGTHENLPPYLTVNFIIQAAKSAAAPTPTTKYAAAIGDGAALAYNVAHGLGTTDVVVSFRDATGQHVEAGWKSIDINTVQVTFSVAPAANSVRIVVIA